ncbi:GAF domain-containing protein [Vibrio coralliilyticus]|uniref:GAF domain-containing protein n=1 Tax=Vibrio coralliilyticus TaxID=190893 RepID=UPI002FD15262
MPFKQLANHQQDLTAELNAIAQQFGLHSLLIMESTPETMIVFAANQQPIYHAGDAGPKSVQPGCHELYCERVVDTQSPLLVADAAADEEWRGNEDLVKFGLGVYYGSPIMHRGEAIGTVCALNDKAFDFAAGEPSAIERLNQLKLRIEQLL